jgi:osmoprotectant transport system ATP-binding protein
LDASASAREALDLLLESGSATLVITNDGKPHGELGFDDLVAATASGSMSSRNDQ